MNKEVLIRFFNGQCTEQEVKMIMTWLHSEKADEYFSDELLDLWEEHARKKSEQPLLDEYVIQKVNESLFEKKKPEIIKNRRNALSLSNKWWIKIAASVIILLSAVGIYLIDHNNNSLPDSEKINLVTKENPKGQKSRIYLPDGSVVWLNSESHIKYPEKFSDSIRFVELEGEAFFEVMKNPDQPFYVKAGHTRTRVLGTSFNINAYPENEGVTISLVEGKISFKFQNENFESNKILTPGEGVHASYNKSTLDSFLFDPKEHLGWKDGLLYFHKADFHTVVSALERWYGVNIEVENQADKSWSFSGTFDNENLSNVLMNLSKMRDFSYEINGKDVLIKF